MLDPVIQNFLNERKANWLKSRLKNKTEAEQALIEQEATDKYALATWLPDAAKRARQLSLTSHPGKFSHPDAKTSSIISDAQQSADGFLRTGNAKANLDVFGNAAALDVYKFLSLKLADGNTILNHLENKTAAIKQQFSISTATFSDIEQGLLAIKQDPHPCTTTDGKLKQVYFPLADDNYHLLSILPPSGLLFKLKNQINNIRFSDEAKVARKARKDNHAHEQGFADIYGLSAMGYGGTKPQNISVLNSQNGGIAYLLPSMPPELNPRTTQPPKTNFFGKFLWLKPYEEDFQKFHQLLVHGKPNIHTRQQRDWLIRSIIYQVIDYAWLIRRLEPGWSITETYQQLPQYQKIWLDEHHAPVRSEDTQWLDNVKQELANWFIRAYDKIIEEKKLGLGDEQLPHIKAIINDCENALQ
ncbi:type I-F CRISPR-associated protein Csy1 [Candidatus Venteria ishoeyi]|uniref:CRISPR-associated protein Csy1 n=1 Tax=Candidatus Venteria ishoeyi TaxID=1899563 RepID=A0A1H6F707_9GAMM|nr:type I-F CRISPR-associated protein Csy1 [Candidatus Venteria ishoeyi]SEH05918.1 CRISPR-associated protein Csy1 [Candidatus Venteria ishoeyi]